MTCIEEVEEMEAELKQGSILIVDGQQAEEIRGGYKACSVSGCYCQEYGGQANTCSNCGHNYDAHW